MVIIVVGLGAIAIDGKFDPPVSGFSAALNSTSSSSWPHNLSITAIQLSGSNYA